MTEHLVLVVDDERSIRSTLKMILEYEGYKVIEAEDGALAIAVARKKRPDAVLLDIKMSGMDGLEVLETLLKDYPDLPVIILSGHGNISTAVQATKLGAFDFLEKPPQRDRILIAVRNALKMSQMVADLRSQEEVSAGKIPIIGSSQALKEVMNLVRKVAPSDLSILIRGESGTGKELTAQAIHQMSPRTGNPFVQVNCAAIPEDLIENELFGHEKGSYTGAADRRPGKFEMAHKGTLFLDEIGDMSLKTQAKVLRAIQVGEFQRVGGSQTLHSDVRIIAATNQDLEEMIAEGTFREDLYYRINVVPIRMPALRERSEDIPLLIEHFTQEFSLRNGMTTVRFGKDAVQLMQQYEWPGNIRELKNFVERHLILSSGSEISAVEITKDLQLGLTGSNLKTSAPAVPGDSLQDFKESAEKQFLIQKLTENRWNIKVTAEAIGTPRSNLYKRMQHFGITRETAN